VSNTFWVILGLVGVALFQCQIIIDLGFEGIPYMIGTIPITILFMSFLTTADVVDFEKKRVNDSWVLLTALSGFGLLYLFQIGSSGKLENLVIFLPFILYLIYFLFIELLINFIDFRIYHRIIKKSKKVVKTGVKAGKKEDEISAAEEAEEKIAWTLFFWLLGFYIIVFFIDTSIKVTYVRIILMVLLIMIPLFTIGKYIKVYYSKSGHANAEPSEKDTQDDLLDDIPLSSQDERAITGLKYLNYLAALGLIIFGFFIIIYYSAYVELDRYILITFSIMVWILILYGFYNLGLPRGGADTKALMAILLIIPIYPIIDYVTIDTLFLKLISDFPELGIEFVFPFAFTVLMNGALIILVIIFYLFFKNAAARNLKFPHAMLGYKMPVKFIPTKFVWPMERIIDGKLRLMVMPDKDLNLENELKILKKAGVEEIWVTPKIPFLIPITIGIILAVVFGNVLFDIIFGIL
jgi:preflagellin peptidase FlaK